MHFRSNTSELQYRKEKLDKENKKMLSQRFEEEKMAVLLYFEKCMESENLPYGSKEREKFMNYGLSLVEDLIAKVSEAYEGYGRFKAQQDLVGSLSDFVASFQEDLVINRVDYMDDYIEEKQDRMDRTMKDPVLV